MKLVYEDSRTDEIRVFETNSHTGLGEEQILIELKSDDTLLEITRESFGLKPEDVFFSFRHHCCDEDFVKDVYFETMGVIETRIFDDINDLEAYLSDFLNKRPSGDCRGRRKLVGKKLSYG